MKSRYPFCLITMTILLFPNIQIQAATTVNDKVEVLIIRPEKLPGYNFRHTTSHTSRDPFNWPTGATHKVTTTPENKECKELIIGLTLQSILWDKATPQAIINNNLVNVGDELKDVFIAQITKDHVIIKKDDCSHPLEFNTKLYDFSKGNGVKN